MPGLKFAPDEKIRPGFQLPGALRDRHGRVLMPAGTVLSDADIGKLGKRLIAGLYVGDDWVEPEPEPAAAAPGPASQPTAPTPVQPSGRRVPASAADDAAMLGDHSGKKTIRVDLLRAGIQLSENIYDQSGVLLMAKGYRITPRCLQLLKEREISVVTMNSESHGDAALATGKAKALRLDQLLDDGAFAQDALTSGQPFARRHLEPEALWIAAGDGICRHRQTSTALNGWCDSVMNGGALDAGEMVHVVNDFIATLTLDADLLPLIISMQQSPDEYLYDHCVSTSMLSMTIAAQLGLSREQIRNVGFGGLLHDVGMLRVPDDIRLAPRALSDLEKDLVRRHPFHTLDILESIRGFPAEASFIAYQVHERLDRTGFPRGRSGMLIHPFAKIVGIADAFVAMTKPRPFRLSKLPHDAIKELLTAGARNQLDRAILRALLDAVSAFPVGSQVELSNGILGAVIRANPGQHTRPMIVEVDGGGRPSGAIIDLASEPSYEVVRALPGATELVMP